MANKCTNKDCVAPISCHIGHTTHMECEHWIRSNTDKSEKPKNKNTSKNNSLPWTGGALIVDNLNQITTRNSPLIIGIVGKPDAGKTTYLAMLFTLLLRGETLESHKFAGSVTLQGWDELYHKLKVEQNNVAFPDPTPAQYIRLLHLALRNSGELLKDVLFSDASGEVFSLWSQNRDDDNAENARWVYKHSDAFLLFIDCVDLAARKNSAKTEIIDIAQMLKHDLKDRPVISVWSKSDKKDEVHPRIVASLQAELNSIFPNHTEIDISNFSCTDPDDRVHKNNLRVIDIVLEKTFIPSQINISIGNENSVGDLFLKYKGNG